MRGSIGSAYASQYTCARVNRFGVHDNTLVRGSIGLVYASQYTCRVGVQGNRSIGLVYTQVNTHVQRSIRMCEGRYTCARANRVGVHVNTHVQGSIGFAYTGLRKSIRMCKGSSGPAYTGTRHYHPKSYWGTRVASQYQFRTRLWVSLGSCTSTCTGPV